MGAEKQEGMRENRHERQLSRGSCPLSVLAYGLPYSLRGAACRKESRTMNTRVTVAMAILLALGSALPTGAQ